jgi:hypothetical protein
MFCNAIVNKIRTVAKMAWGHIDDIMVCDKSKKKLRILIFRIKQWFKQAGWPLNIQKSILKPSKTIEYLGAKWTSKQVTRLPEITKKLKEIIGIIPKIKTQKQLQRIRGYLNYYMGYSGPSHRLISIVLANKKSRILNFKFLYPLLSISKLTLHHKEGRPPDTVICDAAENAVFVYNNCKFIYFLNSLYSNIMHRELYAVLLGIMHHLNCNNFAKKLIVYTDNLPVMYAIRYGSMRFMRGCNNTLLLTIMISLIKATVQVDCRYVRSEENIADEGTRSIDNSNWGPPSYRCL